MIQSNKQTIKWFPDYDNINHSKLDTIINIIFICGVLDFQEFESLRQLKKNSKNNLLCEKLKETVIQTLKVKLNQICAKLSSSQPLFDIVVNMMSSIGKVEKQVFQNISKGKNLIVLSDNIFMKMKLELLDVYMDTWVNDGFEIMIPFSIIEKFDELKSQTTTEMKDIAFTARKVLHFIHQKLIKKKIIQEKCYNYQNTLEKHKIPKTCKNLVILSAKRFQQKNTYDDVFVIHFSDHVIQNNSSKIGVSCFNFVDFVMS